MDAHIDHSAMDPLSEGAKITIIPYMIDLIHASASNIQIVFRPAILASNGSLW